MSAGDDEDQQVSGENVVDWQVSHLLNVQESQTTELSSSPEFREEKHFDRVRERFI